jgi:hypothetical protein
MTSPREWSDHTRFTVSVGLAASILVSVWTFAVWFTHKQDKLDQVIEMMQKHIASDWTLKEEIVQFKNQRILTPDIKLVDPRDSYSETHPREREMQ